MRGPPLPVGPGCCGQACGTPWTASRGRHGRIRADQLRSPRVKAAQAADQAGLPGADRTFLAEGPQAVREALKLDGVTSGAVRHRRGRAAAPRDRHRRPRSRACPSTAPAARSWPSWPRPSPRRGCWPSAGFVHVPLDDAVPAEPRLVAVLAHVRDPGNAGTVLRTADAAGADAVVFTDASVDPYNGKCVRASAGSLFHLPVVIGAPVAQAVQPAAGAGLRVLAADGAGKHTLDDVDLSGPDRVDLRQRGLGAAGGDPRDWPTRWCACRSTAGPRASTWRPPPRCACTPPPGQRLERVPRRRRETRYCRPCRVGGGEVVHGEDTDGRVVRRRVHDRHRRSARRPRHGRPVRPGARRQPGRRPAHRGAPSSAPSAGT